jgi:hypothetical protein
VGGAVEIPGMQLRVVVVVETMVLTMVRGLGVAVTVEVVVAGFAVNVATSVVQGQAVVEAGRTVTSIPVIVCVVANKNQFLVSSLFLIE